VPVRLATLLGRFVFQPPARGLAMNVALALATSAALAVGAAPRAAAADAISFAASSAATQPKMVKIYGAGGPAGLESYQSGFLISAEGHVLTVWSYVLDTDYITATLNDGRKFEAKVIGADPRLEIAVLKIEAADLDHFQLAGSAAAETGARVLAFSNLFGVATGDEPDSVQHGVISAKTRLDGRRGAYATPYRGPVYVLDAMTNNPGAPGGALTNLRGELLGLLGKELRNSQNNIWLNYALPVNEMTSSVDEIMAGKTRPGAERKIARKSGGPDLARLGAVLVPDVLERTPPFIDDVRPNSPAALADLRADDLVVFVGDRLVQSLKALNEELAQLEPESDVRLVILRGQELIDVVLKADPSGGAAGEPRSTASEKKPSTNPLESDDDE
jgi:S1-C subfamily serine protease